MDVTSPFRLPRKTPFGLGENIAEWATGLSKLEKLYAQRPLECDTNTFLRYTLDVLGIDYTIEQGSLNSVSAEGATLVVANHPLGCVEGVILAELLLMIRSDVQILANHYLKTVPELDELFIGVDVFEGSKAARANMKALRAANKHLESGGLLLVFPAGEVSHLVDKPTQKQQLEDKEWSRSIASFVRKHKAVSVPVFIDGHNSKRFYMAGKVHPLLRTMMLGRELLNKHSLPIKISIGEPVKYKEVANLTDQQVVNYLRLNTYLLHRAPQASEVTSTQQEPLLPIAQSLPINDFDHDLQNLPSEALLLSSNEFDVYCTTAEHIPAILHEIGRCREENFRAAGEGTGFAIDIDQFDRDYLHLFVWDRENHSLVGAYRLGVVEQICQQNGLNGLYSRSLFEYDEPFLNTMPKSIEMGRSVVAARYQKSMSALLLLWKGIATYVHRNPQFTHLFGPVSISNDYSPEARHLLAETMQLHHYDQTGAQLVKASHPRPQPDTAWNTNLLTALADIQLLSRVIARIDSGKSVPVLLRQYLALNGKLVCFNVDPSFNNALDGLIVVDLRNVPSKTLGRYMGTEEAENYLLLHR
ncbi:lysophospholipid acyltransferase family protein [Vibrio paucivorans]|uniref:L-ornithine N(alpha)-acyltransferase n=1 Tax=Vibrio paucivorans TaxID=2829489 RepID=A0A9X3CB92_9VIBR|nr:GNAT family N-acyltransferase [Vibrio paucivorans]MCW8332493.1 lysophospholipid acyltransferase family protein [Vibrio paucivorans]